MVLHPFTTYVLRNYYAATGWNEDNLYGNLTRSSEAILDFDVPTGLRVSVSKAPNSLFRTTYSLNALPTLTGTLGYIFTSCELDLKNSAGVRLKDMVGRFKVYDQPRRPEERPEEWLAGERIDKRDYLMSGLIHVPSGRLDAYYTTRLSRTLQASVSAITNPHSTPTRPMFDGSTGSGHLLLGLQHDTGRWCTDYTWDSDGGLWGVKVLRNFGKLANSDATEDNSNYSGDTNAGLKRVDEEDAMEGGLRGRISAGAELFVGSEKSAGVSLGVRFATLHDLDVTRTQAVPLHPRTPPSQPPTIITSIINPITGQIETAYAARASKDLSLCSRFTFNMNSYDSEWTMGAEWWMRRKPLSSTTGSEHEKLPELGTLDNLTIPSTSLLATPNHSGDIQGVIKARISTSARTSFIWEGRFRSALLSVGVVSDLSNRSTPITAIGLELAYFSSDA
ncbi:hypothetical protein BD410DRAFT_779869 [Rickenella mellea]|uniref:Mitochondrial distribution and morphology protein 10 n=1 Tax=Rickenella mellea TaxID=50990 RepID=A0A4R5XGX8_9AGAM|nr:hypothetical protein BD410DRAFT_779869 [Rickenella mellea]